MLVRYLDFTSITVLSYGGWEANTPIDTVIGMKHLTPSNLLGNENLRRQTCPQIWNEASAFLHKEFL